MIEFLLILILSLLISYILFSLIGEEKSQGAKITENRLKKIKNRDYDTTKKDSESKKGILYALIKDEEYKFSSFGLFLEKLNYVNQLKQILKIADIKIDVSQFFAMIIMLFIFGVIFGLISPAKGNVIIILFIGAFFATFPPFFIIKRKIAKRLNLFTNQLPDALGLISSSLRAGHSLPSSFAIVVQDMPDPICSVFKLAYEDINMGRSTKEAMDNMTSYIPGSLDLKFFVTAVLIQREIGGNLAEILDNLNNTIRERFKLLGQIKSQTAQASLSGMVLALAPLVIGLIIYVLNPKYMEPLFTNPLGKGAIGLAIFLGCIGFFIIKKITTIRV